MWWWRAFHFAAGLVGAYHGYRLWQLAASQEDWAFYTIRSTVTGKKVMCDIYHHPADFWVWWGLVVAFWASGATAGLLASGLVRRMWPRRPE